MRARRNFIRIIAYSCLLTIMLGLVSGVGAQEEEYRFKVVQVDDTQFPKVETYVQVLDPLGRPVDVLTGDNFSLFEDGREIFDFQVERRNNDQQSFSLVLLIEVSDRMVNDLELLKQQEEATLATFVDTLPNQDSVAVVIFTEESKVLHELNVDKTEIPFIIQNLKAEGFAALYDGLSDSVDYLADKPTPRVILLISSGVEAGYSEVEPEEFIEAANENNVQVYVLGLGNLVYEDVLNEVADKTGGKTVFLPGEDDVERIDELKEALVNLQMHLDELRTQYVLTYDSELNSNGSNHEVRVAVDYQGWHEEDSGEFTACPGVVKVCLPDYVPEYTVPDDACFTPIVSSPAPPTTLDVYMDGENLCHVIAAPFTCCLEPNMTGEGDHSFDFEALDEDGNTGDLSTTLSVRPSVKVTVDSPAERDQLQTKLQFISDVDSLSKITLVVVNLGDREIARFDNPTSLPGGPPYLYSINEELDISTAITGEHTLTVKAVDVEDKSSETSVGVQVLGYPPNRQVMNPLWILPILAVVVVVIVLVTRSRREGKGAAAGGAAGAQAILRELEGLYPNQTWDLSSAEVKLGRNAESNDIPLKGLNASRNMAIIQLHEGKHYINSLNPQNPALVNEAPVQQQMLNSGDLIRLGESLFRYESLE